MTRKQSGLGRVELIWTVVVLSLVTVLIVNTLRSEVARAKERMCLDSLAYLSAQIHVGLEQLEYFNAEQLEDYYLGPGTPPSFFRTEHAHLLSKLLPAGISVPKDPWQNAFVLHKVTQGDDSEFWLVSGGENGEYPEWPITKNSLARRLHLPYVASQH
ncbi:MAG: hypothetical protein OSB63_06220 [Planctomycetota bacterium]|nr:hypothetical protein [Planctomycetota bacterium]